MTHVTASLSLMADKYKIDTVASHSALCGALSSFAKLLSPKDKFLKWQLVLSVFHLRSTTPVAAKRALKAGITLGDRDRDSGDRDTWHYNLFTIIL